MTILGYFTYDTVVVFDKVRSDLPDVYLCRRNYTFALRRTLAVNDGSFDQHLGCGASPLSVILIIGSVARARVPWWISRWLCSSV